jgi:chromate reductase, NAD(P)H dehydrogenase (quinone)
MSTVKIAVVVGSLRKDSLNRKLATALAKLAPAGVELTQLQIGDLPLYNQDEDGNQPPQVVRLRNEIKAAHGVIFVTPEYNRSIPGVLKNAIDSASRPWGQSAWKGKPAGVVGVSVSPVGAALAQTHLRTILAHMDMPTLGQPEVFIQAKDDLFQADGSIGAGSQAFVQGWLDTYLAWVKAHTA